MTGEAVKAATLREVVAWISAVRVLAEERGIKCFNNAAGILVITRADGAKCSLAPAGTQAEAWVRWMQLEDASRAAEVRTWADLHARFTAWIGGVEG